MSLPASGQLSFRYIYYEIYRVYPSSNDDVALYTTLTAVAGYQPKVEPHKVSEFYNYDHSSYATLNLSIADWTFGQGAATKTVTVNASLGNAWCAYSDQGWLTFKTDEGWSNCGIGTGGAQYFMMKVTVNDEGPPDRTATVTVLSDAPDETIAIIQQWH